MRVAVDKDSLGAINTEGNEYIYIFHNESYKELLKLGLHCISSQYCKDEYVDINLTNYQIDSIKNAKITDKEWNQLVSRDYKI